MNIERLGNLKSAPPKKLATKLNKAAQRMVKKGHPWVFEQGITKIKEGGETGDLAIIFDNYTNKFIGCGLLDLESAIRIKMLHTQAGINIDEAWFQNRVEDAFALRDELLETHTTGYRLLHGENDGLPALICDVYEKTAVVKLYSGIWWRYLPQILPAILDVTNCETIVLRMSRNVLSSDNQGFEDGEVIFGKLKNDVIVFKEHGVLFAANVVKGHKTGHFLDHRANRKRVGNMAKGKTVLDIFAYNGGFSVHALAGGASEVHSIDISQQALEMAAQNAELNPHKGEHFLQVGDAFKVLETMVAKRQKFDIVVIDPPSLAKRANEAEIAMKKYRKLIQFGMNLCAKGGVFVMASCSSRVLASDFFALVETTLEKSKGHFQLLETTAHDDDHPISFDEGAYLKCAYYRRID